MIRINEILDKAGAYLSGPDQALIQKAYVFSAAAHAGQIRLSGEPYLSHPLEVSNILAEMRLDAPTIAAGLLHDTVEDTKATMEEIDDQFGRDVAKIVSGVTKIGKMSFESKEEAQAENIRKMILAMADDIRVIMVKLADRIHNMSTLEFQKPIKQKMVAQETMDIYAPLANRLGLYRIKIKLEDLSLRYLKPDVYFQVEEGLKKHEYVGDQYIQKVCTFIEDVLKKNQISGKISGRLKHVYSIYHKMMQQGLTLDQVYDVIAFRVIVDSIKDCYAVLGLVHSIWKPVPGRFKDYISMPKANMYQSLHTTVIGPDGERVEIQIRTDEMHKMAEFGVASHWKYKEDGKLNEKDAERFNWLRQILDWQEELKDPREFMASLRFDLFEDEVYVFTPRGQVKELPEGATPIDFAYLIHSEVGDRCSGARVNGKLVPLNSKLKNGDTVEIITDPHRHPSRDWLKLVKTAKARTRIKQWIRNEERQQSISLAREVLDKEGRKLGININQAFKKGRFKEIAADYSLNSEEDLLSAIGYARITPRQVLNKLLPREEEVKDESLIQEEQKFEEKAVHPGAKKEGIRIKGVGDVMVRFAQCCNPLPGDPIVGYISRGRGVAIHTTDCQNVQEMEPERQIEVFWESELHKSFPAKVKIICANQKGVLAKISTLLTKEDVNIDSGSFKSNVDGKSELLFTVMVHDSSHLYDSIGKLRKLKEVVEVTRLSE
ncbi:RelA/SpoT family protein [Desulfonatronovibrio magnus]|uniref:RelA/SpoT family protein n=1 Tax=Desulfonatronovibrio magnus TaxID=698827 RepID=UPI0005EB56B8|nr:bifunctional (p)ppGpp synthetase/guanosine-3',5'-bis(diphosphate) 3'-pyrophosphohydrolase [Desulfonatronovibrio magnus]